MLLSKLTLNDFKIFEGKNEFYFNEVNLILGPNGRGKSTLIKDSLLFLLYGYCSGKLLELPTKGKSETCSVEAEIDDFIIKRSIPTDISIKKDGIEIDLATNADKNKFLAERFKNIDYFKKFRMIDITEGINILEEGKKGFVKTLFSFNKDYLNSIREKLMSKKREREVYNKDNVPYKLYPSEKRHSFLLKSIRDINETLSHISFDINELEKKYLDKVKKTKEKEANIDFLKSKRARLLKYNKCPICERDISDELRNSLVNELNDKIKYTNEIISSINSTIFEEKELIAYYKNNKNILQNKKEKLNTLKVKLEGRLKQKDYKWSKKDVVVIKKAIEQLDIFSNSYIKDWIKILEPIINDIISTIGFEVNFKLDDKGDIDIKLIKEGLEYNYKELSSGQKLILSSAFQLALLLEKGEDGLIVIDEGMSSLDETNLNNMLELFKNLPFQPLIVIHRLEKIPDGIKVINLK